MPTGRLKVWNPITSTWEYVAPGLMGPTGPQGATGPQGTTGPTGTQGFTGTAGTNGTNGAQGFTGPQGATGVQGATGPAYAVALSSTTSASSLTPASASFDMYAYTALAANLSIAQPTGTTNGKKLMFRIKDNGTARTISLSSTYYRDFTGKLPNVMGILGITTTPNKVLYLGFIYNAADSLWDCLAVQIEP